MTGVVCLLYSDALSAPEVAWSLVDAGFAVIALARRGRQSALQHSRRVTCREVTGPEVDLETAQAEVARTLQTLESAGRHPVAVLPLDDAAVWLCARLQLDSGCVLTGPRGRLADFALTKGIQIESARDAGLKVPATTIACSSAGVRERQAELPLVLRPAQAVLADKGPLRKGKNWICADRGELEQAIASWAEAYPLLVQPYIAGRGEGVFGLATNDGVKAWSAHRRLRMMNPHGSGSSACRSQPVPAGVKPAVQRLVQGIGWRGLFMVELLCDHSGVPWFIEFNGRPWGSMALSRRQGLEYPAWAVQTALGYDLPTIAEFETPKPIVCRNAGRELMHLLFVLRGRKSKALKGWPPFWRTAREVLAIRREDAFYNWRRDDWRVFVADSWYAIRQYVGKTRN